MKLQKFVFIGIVIVFTGILALPSGSFACWGTGNYLIECCFACCETQNDCDNFRNNPQAGYNCRYNWYCLFRPGYCRSEEVCPSGPFGGTCPSSDALNNDEEKIETLRRFRDEVLSKTPVGREYIKLYYQWSPVVLQMMQEDEELKEEVQALLEELWPLIEEMLE